MFMDASAEHLWAYARNMGTLRVTQTPFDETVISQEMQDACDALADVLVEGFVFLMITKYVYD